MKTNKEELKTAILFLAKTIDREKNYTTLFEHCVMPKIVELIVYDLFLTKFNPYYCGDEQYAQYKIIHEYAAELKENGWVIFNN